MISCKSPFNKTSSRVTVHAYHIELISSVLSSIEKRPVMPPLVFMT